MKSDGPATHRAALERLGLTGRSCEALASYLDILARWSPSVNLTGARSAPERVAILVAPVLPVAALVRAGRLLDVGSGNGSPGVVLALLRPDVAVTLLEPRLKRWAFLREAVRAVAPQADVQRQRYQDYVGSAADTLTVRALRVRLDELRRLLAPSGRVIAWGEAPTADPRFRARASGVSAVHVFDLEA